MTFQNIINYTLGKGIIMRIDDRLAEPPDRSGYKLYLISFINFPGHLYARSANDIELL